MTTIPAIWALIGLGLTMLTIVAYIGMFLMLVACLFYFVNKFILRPLWQFATNQQ